MAGIDISKLQNAWFDDEDTEEEVTETHTSSVSKESTRESTRKAEKKDHEFKFFSQKQREEFKNIKTKEDLDRFYKTHVDGKFEELEKQADIGLQITKSANTSSQEWEEGNKIFNDATEQMVQFVTDLLHLKM